MKGLDLRTFRLDLHKVEPDSTDPAQTIKWKPKLKPFMGELGRIFHLPFDFKKHYHSLSLRYFANFSFDELCKLKYSTRIMMREDVDKLYERKAQYEIIRKIENSFWRCGYERGSWNEIVDAYNNIRGFSLGDLPDFKVRFDHTTYHNECGWSKYARVYLDGVFTFLVYYKQKHVFTIGFSIASGRKLLIQQVQSAQRKSNRSLYKLPSNRIEFVIDLFSKNFPGYEIYLVDGTSLTNKVIQNYQDSLRNKQDSIEQWTGTFSKKWIKEAKADCLAYEQKIAHLQSRQSHIVDYYANAGRFKLKSKPVIFNQLRHRPVFLSVR